jgi:hypothetical protein
MRRVPVIAPTRMEGTNRSNYLTVDLSFGRPSIGNRKGRDVGHALVASCCEEANNVQPIKLRDGLAAYPAPALIRR